MTNLIFFHLKHFYFQTDIPSQFEETCFKIIPIILIFCQTVRCFTVSRSQGITFSLQVLFLNLVLKQMTQRLWSYLVLCLIGPFSVRFHPVFGSVQSQVPSSLWFCPVFGSIQSLVPSSLWFCLVFGSVQFLVLTSFWFRLVFGSIQSSLFSLCFSLVPVQYLYLILGSV